MQNLFQAGYGQAIVNPPLGMPMEGLGQQGGCQTIHDDLYVRALFLSQDDMEVLILGCDLLFFERHEIERFRQAVGRLRQCVGRMCRGVGRMCRAVGRMWRAVGRMWRGVGRMCRAVGRMWRGVGRMWRGVGRIERWKGGNDGEIDFFEMSRVGRWKPAGF